MTDVKERIKQEILKVKDTIRIKVRFNDTDAMGVVHFINYLIYFDDGFISFMKNIENPVESRVKEGIVFPVKKVNAIYEDSAVFGDFVIVETSVKEIGNTSITFTHDIYKESNNKILAKIECVRLVMELKTKKLLNVLEFFVKYV